MTDGATFLRQLPVSDADRAKIAHLNAERLLHTGIVPFQPGLGMALSALMPICELSMAPT